MVTRRAAGQMCSHWLNRTLQGLRVVPFANIKTNAVRSFYALYHLSPPTWRFDWEVNKRAHLTCRMKTLAVLFELTNKRGSNVRTISRDFFCCCVHVRFWTLWWMWCDDAHFISITKRTIKSFFSMGNHCVGLPSYSVHWCWHCTDRACIQPRRILNLDRKVKPRRL